MTAYSAAMIHGGYSTFEMRLAAVQAVSSSGLAIGHVAKAYGTDRTTVFRWIKRYAQDSQR
ncbi:MAG: helix-turn-helix domain-containing protein, partial [Planctomycetes bacterium]|nr:helix-turn-helix domain-containing protein [Planctomycetota bacterium]